MHGTDDQINSTKTNR